MGVAGTLEYFSDLLSNVKKGKKRKQMQTVALKVRMDCEGCERKIKSVLSGVKGTYMCIDSGLLLLYFFNFSVCSAFFSWDQTKLLTKLCLSSRC
jgi:hypothetical protein